MWAIYNPRGVPIINQDLFFKWNLYKVEHFKVFFKSSLHQSGAKSFNYKS